MKFSRSRKKNSKDDHRPIAFRCQESPWSRDNSIRRIIAKVSRPGAKDITVSIITSHPDMDIQDVVWAIFRRWVQENDFKYLDSHFGFNQLTSRDSCSFAEAANLFEDRPVDSPEYKELKNTLRTLESKLGKRILRLRKAEKEQHALEIHEAKLKANRAELLSRLEKVINCLQENRPRPRNDADIEAESVAYRAQCRKLTAKRDANKKKQSKLRDEIATLDREIELLEAQLCEAVRKESRLQLLISGNYRYLDTRKKSMMDALRVVASNMFRNVQEQFRVILNDFRDDHVLVRMLSRSAGSITRTADAVIFKLWLPGTIQEYRLRALKLLLQQVEEKVNSQIQGHRKLHLSLMTGPIKT